jgi:hypothetical protein
LGQERLPLRAKLDLSFLKISSLLTCGSLTEAGRMPAIDLIFPEELDESHVRNILSRPDSGFDVEERVPLDSAVIDGFTVAGVVFNAFSLATAIWALKAQLEQSAKNRKTTSKEIRVRRVRTSEIRLLPTGEVKSIETTLEEFSRSDR